MEALLCPPASLLSRPLLNAAQLFYLFLLQGFCENCIIHLKINVYHTQLSGFKLVSDAITPSQTAYE
jgi:hypothetical protein